MLRIVKDEHMKIDRLIGILSILLQKEMITTPELAEHFGVSRRTIGRDIEGLCKAGIPIRTMQGSGGGISIMNGYRMDRTLLTSRDMQMILAGLRSLDSVSGSRYYGQLMEKIQAGSSELISGRDSILIDLSSWYKTSLAPKIATIQDAIENRHILEFDYYFRYVSSKAVLSTVTTFSVKAPIFYYVFAHRSKVPQSRLLSAIMESQKAVCVNDVNNGSPSRILIVRLISFGMTTLPRSSILLTIPVAFIYK